MNAKVAIKVTKKIGKVVVTVGVPLAANYIESKTMETKMRKVAEEVLSAASKKNN